MNTLMKISFNYKVKQWVCVIKFGLNKFNERYCLFVRIVFCFVFYVKLHGENGIILIYLRIAIMVDTMQITKSVLI